MKLAFIFLALATVIASMAHADVPATPEPVSPGMYVCSDNISATSNDFQDWLNANCDTTRPFTQTWVELSGNSYITGCCIQR